MYRAISLATALIATASAQQACTSTSETHPPLTWNKCTDSGCTEVSGSVVVDANWRWTHTVDGSTNCYTGNEWDTSLCPDGETCAEKCCVDGADYSGTYGVTSSADQLSLSFVTKGAYSTNVGSRLYLMEDEETYQMFTLLGNEFTFDVDVSKISCGLNGALYFVSMDEDGGKAKYDGNKAGAKFGTGYCDAQCARDVKFINGVGNVENWTPSDSDPNSGTGNLGSCCPEMDIWEANDMATAFTPHPCKTLTQHSCEGDKCGGTYSTSRYAGTCDPDGCDFNPFRQGNETFYGPGSEYTVDTTKKVTVVTQFIKGSSGGLSEIKRFYVQNGKVIGNPESKVASNEGNSITEDFCTAQKKAFGDDDDFAVKGGFSQMSDALAAPMVLVMSLWDDHYANMLWLDSTYPADSTGAGSKRGSCSTDSGVPKDVEADSPDSKVVFSNIKFGPIGSTFEGGDSASSDSGSSSGSSSKAASAQPATKTAASGAQTSAASKPQTTVVSQVKSQTSAAAQEEASAPAAEEPKVSTTKAAAAPAATTEVKAPATTEDASEEEEECEADPEDAQPSTDSGAQPSSASAAQPSAGSGSEDSGSSTIAAYHQCGGQNWTGATKCASGYTCKEQNPYYSQCVVN
ncbi:exoglucanase type C [Fusarium albosuccineum]|uniref:Glucanase n=1 Tax=Fusarium albosuccineum TaxID=1237068 RepID=A0A8H4PH49_9HYPO|nr:exoglucanase type C [Fusarium albosuccineum]